MPVPLKMPDGSELQAERVDFRTVRDDGTTVELPDGTRIKVRCVVMEVYRTDQQDELGRPVFVVRHQALALTEHPEGEDGARPA